MALVLVCLILFLVTRQHRYVTIGAVLLLCDMIAPALFAPAARLWFGLSHVLGTVMSKLMLSIVFFVVLWPMGFARRLCGKDPMQLRIFGRDQASVFRIRNHTFTASDIEQPY